MEDLLSLLQQNWTLTLALGFLVVALIAVECWASLAGPKKLTPMEATQLINRENAIVVDIRSLEAYQRGHILSTKHIPVTELSERAPKLLKNKKTNPIIVVCDSGKQSNGGVTELTKLGFEKVFCLQGGLQSWQEENFPLERG